MRQKLSKDAVVFTTRNIAKAQVEKIDIMKLHVKEVWIDIKI